MTLLTMTRTDVPHTAQLMDTARLGGPTLDWELVHAYWTALEWIRDCGEFNMITQFGGQGGQGGARRCCGSSGPTQDPGALAAGRLRLLAVVGVGS